VPGYPGGVQEGTVRAKAPVTRATDVLVFDGDCAFCTGIARWLDERLPQGTGTIPWQWLADPSSYGLTRKALASAAYWIDSRGRPHRGHHAAARAMQAMGGGWSVLGQLIEVPPFSWVAWALYEIVARNRHRLPGPVPACRADRQPGTAPGPPG
jgi:predicted DCC family thiol-disulfide oxidoreductase YuxK